MWPQCTRRHAQPVRRCTVKRSSGQQTSVSYRAILVGIVNGDKPQKTWYRVHTLTAPCMQGSLTRQHMAKTEQPLLQQSAALSLERFVM